MMPQSQPRLCIGLPVYNGQKYLASTLESLLGQTFADFRLIVSDNGSTDATEDICRGFARRDRRVDYHRSATNRGMSWNFNRLVALADSEYFKWAAYDDLHAPQFLERCIAALDADPQVIVCYPTAKVIDEHDGLTFCYREPADTTLPVPAARFREIVWNWGCGLMQYGVVRLAVLRQTQLHGAYPASDAVLIAELALRGPFRQLDEPLFFWRNHPDRPTHVCTSDAELATWFAPENAGRAQFRHLKLFVSYLRTIGRVPLPVGQKLRCAGVMAHWFAVKLPIIQDEVRGNIARPVRRALARWSWSSRRPGSPSRAA